MEDVPILNEDLFEEDIAFNCYCFNNIIDGEEMIAAWEYLNPGERRAWREFVRIGKERDHDRTR